jgi:glyoxylase-like metal-dependent hydrolase (beta-lactamase superfamily II)
MSQTPASTLPPMQVAILPVTPLQQNCTLLWCTATMKAAVIDPGGDLDRIKALVAKAGVTVEKLLITHGHLDHCGGAAQLARELGVPIEGRTRRTCSGLPSWPRIRAAGACRRKSSRPAAGWSRATR